jgi:hypothetical protein
MPSVDSSAEVATDAEGSGQSTAMSAGTLLFRVVAGLVIVASFGVWVYAYSGLAERDAPDLLADEELKAQAEAICAAAVADVAAMPNALDAVDGPDRGRQIRNATGRFSAMVDELARLTPAQSLTNIERDQQIYQAWLGDWRVLLDDRLDYADRIAADPDAIFYITDTGVNERLDKRITRFANTNSMTSCAAPTDV